jgi:hypothetical protein
MLLYNQVVPMFKGEVGRGAEPPNDLDGHLTDREGRGVGVRRVSEALGFGVDL